LDIRTLFTPLANLERELARLYGCFSDRLDTIPAARTLFYRMSLDEKAHLALVLYQKRLVQRSPKLFENVQVDLAEVLDLTRQIDALARSQEALSLEKAVALALKFEATSAESHYRLAILDSRPEMASLLWNLELADRQHVGALKEFAARHDLAYLL
jgi:hypothetical protein